MAMDSVSVSFNPYVIKCLKPNWNILMLKHYSHNTLNIGHTITALGNFKISKKTYMGETYFSEIQCNTHDSLHWRRQRFLRTTWRTQPWMWWKRKSSCEPAKVRTRQAQTVFDNYITSPELLLLLLRKE